MFLVYSKVMLRYVVSEVGKLPNFKKISTIMNMLALKILKDIHVFNGMAQFFSCFIKNFAFIMAPITKLLHKT
jgi:hypothetical protein